MSRIRGHRLLVTLLCAGHAAAFHWGYRQFLVPIWGYWGFSYVDVTPMKLVIAYGLTLIPSLTLPTVLERPSSFLCWILYLVAYVPSILTISFRGDTSYDATRLMMALAAGLVIIVSVRFVPLPAPSKRQLSPLLFWMLLIFCYCLFSAVILWTYGGSLRFVSFEESSTLRLQAREIDNVASGYVLPLLSNVWNPLLMTHGLFRRRRAVFLLGVAGQVFLYTTAAMKSILLSPLVLVAVFVVIRRRPRSAVPLLLLGCVLLLTVVACLVVWYQDEDVLPQPVPQIGALTLLRTFGIPGVNTAIYADFFSRNPVTYWSHVRGLNRITRYPYPLAVPYIIGGAYYGTEVVSANAHFWAQDGIAAYRSPGVLIISFFAALIFWLIDAAGRHLNREFSMVFVTVFAVTLSNGSIFTNLLTGGLGVALLLLIGMPRSFTGLAQAAPGKSRPMRRRLPAAGRSDLHKVSPAL